MPRSTFEARTPLQSLLMEQALLMARRLEQAADAAPDGQVLKQVEVLAVDSGRELARKALEAVLQAQAPEAEKKGAPAGLAPPAADRSVPKDGPPATS